VTLPQDPVPTVTLPQDSLPIKDREPGVREPRIALEPDVAFDKIVEVSKDSLSFRSNG